MTADGSDRSFGAPRFDVVLRGYDRRQVDEHLSRLWPFKVELDDLERLLRFESDSGAGLHYCSSLLCASLLATYGGIGQAGKKREMRWAGQTDAMR